MANWYVTPSYKDLMHYGVLGMKWGIRRYQNKDGTLTAAGIKKQKQLREKYTNKNYQGGQKDYILKKGTTKLYRVSNSNEKIDNYRKYVTIDKDDFVEEYLTYYTMLPIDKTKPVSAYTYINKKDLKVAGYDTVMDYIIKNTNYEKPIDFKIENPKTKHDIIMYNALKMLKNKNFKELHDEYIEQEKYNIKYTEIFNKKEHAQIGKNYITDLLAKKASIVEYSIRNLKHEFDRKEGNEKAIEYFKNKGYDAICDALDFDVSSTNGRGSIIILDPKESMKLIEEKDKDNFE